MRHVRWLCSAITLVIHKQSAVSGSIFTYMLQSFRCSFQTFSDPLGMTQAAAKLLYEIWQNEALVSLGDKKYTQCLSRAIFHSTSGSTSGTLTMLKAL